MGTKVEIKLTHHGPWFMATNHGQFFGRFTLHDLRKGTTKSGQRSRLLKSNDLSGILVYDWTWAVRSISSSNGSFYCHASWLSAEEFFLFFILKWTQGDLLRKRPFCDLKRSKRHYLLTLNAQMVSWSNLNYIMTSDLSTKHVETLSFYFKNSRMSNTPRMPDFKTASPNDSVYSPFIHQKPFKEKKTQKN